MKHNLTRQPLPTARHAAKRIVNRALTHVLFTPSNLKQPNRHFV
ncbi:hypothetical protein C7S16_1993 [Burkholderia thailandensis]|uniref:Uncharacterized protein n=1 Tax=Burkholderia thailandensis TaxID=57975 RepID=A0AAW9D3G2_BURTH|nr:hypothetical protein [Burkholderia thailandensis]